MLRPAVLWAVVCDLGEAPAHQDRPGNLRLLAPEISAALELWLDMPSSPTFQSPSLLPFSTFLLNETLQNFSASTFPSHIHTHGHCYTHSNNPVRHLYEDSSHMRLP